MSELTQQQQDLFRKIRGLLRKAEVTNYEGEASVFIKKAQELMYTHAVDEELLWSSEPDNRPKPIIEDVYIKKNATGAQFQRVVLQACAKYNRCKMWYQGSTCKVCGFDSDVTYVMMLYASIVSQMNLAMAIAMGQSKENPKTFRSNFIEAFAYRIYDRLRETQKELHTTARRAHGQALVLSRDFKIEEFMREQGISLRSTSLRRGGRYSDSAQSAGDTAARNTDISGGRGRVGTAGRKAIG